MASCGGCKSEHSVQCCAVKRGWVAGFKRGELSCCVCRRLTYRRTFCCERVRRVHSVPVRYMLSCIPKRDPRAAAAHVLPLRFRWQPVHCRLIIAVGTTLPVLLLLLLLLL